MRMSQPRMIMPIALVAVAALVALVFAVPALTGNLEVRQTETYQLHTFDRSQYFPAEAIVTVAAPKTMYVAEGRDYVDVKVDLVKRDNVSGFKMTKLDCYLGTLNDLKLTPSEFNFHVFGENGSTFHASVPMDPKAALHDARIQITMGIEIFYEDGHSVYLGGFTTQPVFGLYAVQDRFHLLLYSIPVVLIGAAVISALVSRKTDSAS